MGVTGSAEVASHRNLHTGLPSNGSSDLSQSCYHYCSVGIFLFGIFFQQHGRPEGEVFALTVLPASRWLFGAGIRFPRVRLLVLLELRKRPWSLREGDGGRSPVRGVRLCSLRETFPLGPCTDAIHGAPGHNRWRVAEIRRVSL